MNHPAHASGSDVLMTQRLILRRWNQKDAEDLYRYACDPDVGPIAGWPPHKSIDESRAVIRDVLNGREAYAICLKEDGRAIGAIELKLNGHTDLTDRDDECEMGYWLGKPFWGRGIVPEAVAEMLRRAFEDIGMQKVWVGYYEGNSKSKRVQEKCRFRFQLPLSAEIGRGGCPADAGKTHRVCEQPDEGPVAVGQALCGCRCGEEGTQDLRLRHLR